MKLKKFGQFVNMINEETEFDDDFKLDQDEETLVNDEETLSSDEDIVGEEEEPEEGYVGDKALLVLAEKLGVKVDEDNSINYNGVKVNWFSENSGFNIGKKVFKTDLSNLDSVTDEVVEYLNAQSQSEEVEDVEDVEDFDEISDIEDEDDVIEDEDLQNESFKHIRKFK